jgi:glycerophosphoryl diester phosphodiesterase
MVNIHQWIKIFIPGLFLVFGKLTCLADTAPVADVLDVVFHQDGTSEDVSPMHSTVDAYPAASLCTYYSDVYERYVARFDNETPGVSVTSGYYRMNYSGSNNIKNALADGHTLEAFFSSEVPLPLPNSEIKVFSSHESGGTGLMLGNSARGNSIIFLPHAGSGYVWTNSGIQPKPGRYYHVVGVWDKSANKSYIYVDGELKASASTGGNFNMQSSAYQWFGIGADAGSSGQSCWKGDVVLARIYDKALTASDVTLLWDQVKNRTPGAGHIGVRNISLPFEINLLPGCNYTIQGSGFSAGDNIRLQPLTGNGESFVCTGTPGQNSLTITLPESLVPERYRFILLRGEQSQDLGFTSLYFSDLQPNERPTKIIAHRGYWNIAGSAQNSITSLQKAQELDIYGSEFDVWITVDGVVVLNHDPTINSIRIENATYNQLKDLTLSNGEKLPTLENYLSQGKQHAGVKLILEVKTHSTTEKNNRVVAACIEKVNAENMKEQVEYIAFSQEVCKEILRLQPDAVVAYLNGDLAPQTLHGWQVSGIDYQLPVLRNHPEWIREAHALGMTVNVWTVNNEVDMREMILAGVDYITTDNPFAGKKLTTGVDRIEAPANDVNVHYQSGKILVRSLTGINSVILFDVYGRKLQQIEAGKEREIGISVSPYPAGIYVLWINSGNRRVYFKFANA